jgi:hypothetical protein
MTSSRRKYSLLWPMVLAGGCLLTLIPATLCWLLSRAFQPTTAPDPFPEADIVYHASGFGFVNADGSGATSVRFATGYNDLYGSWQDPLITGDGRMILVTHTIAAGSPGLIFAAPAGGEPVNCGWSGRISLAGDEIHVLVNTDVEILKYRLEDCGSGHAPVTIYREMPGFLSPDAMQVAQVERSNADAGPRIRVRDLQTGDAWEVGVGDFLVWSPNGEWLAYTGVDGIYIVQNSPDSQPQRLVYMENPYPALPDPHPVYASHRAIEYNPPIASWSPDGKWLVYHHYRPDPPFPEAGLWLEHYAIYKVNVQTGEIIKLVDAGYSPSWRGPAKP